MALSECHQDGGSDPFGMNLRWIVTETVHTVNNVLGGIQYAVYALQQETNTDILTNTQLIQERVEVGAGILRSLFDLARAF